MHQILREVLAEEHGELAPFKVTMPDGKIQEFSSLKDFDDKIASLTKKGTISIESDSPARRRRRACMKKTI
jgi:hypothetical protein